MTVLLLIVVALLLLGAWLGYKQLQPPLPPSNARTPAMTAESRSSWELEEVRQQMRLSEWDEARRMLQKISYGMVDAPAHEKAQFTSLMAEFAARDPLCAGVLRVVLPLVRAQPGIVQKALYKHLPGVSSEEVRYVLYFAEQLQVLSRVKKGNSYQLFERL